jgi:hypothetical protein
VNVARQLRQLQSKAWLPWACGALLGAYSYLFMIVQARIDILGRFDDGIEYTTVTYLLHGQLPFTDFYEPYGIGLGIPGVLPHLFGFDGAFALRLTYGIFPALVTLLVTPLVWRRSGAALGLLVGVISLSSQTPRYSMGFAALFGFILIVDRSVRATATASLREAAVARPWTFLVASMLCSLAGWARTEYAIFVVLWGVVLLFVLEPGRLRWLLAGARGAPDADRAAHRRFTGSVVVHQLHAVVVQLGLPRPTGSAGRTASADRTCRRAGAPALRIRYARCRGGLLWACPGCGTRGPCAAAGAGWTRAFVASRPYVHHTVHGGGLCDRALRPDRAV